MINFGALALLDGMDSLQNATFIVHTHKPRQGTNLNLRYPRDNFFLAAVTKDDHDSDETTIFTFRSCLLTKMSAKLPKISGPVCSFECFCVKRTGLLLALLI